MRKLLFLLSLSIVILSCGTEDGGNENKQLQLHLEKGARYEFNQSSTMSIKQEIQGQPMNMEMELVANTTFEVTDQTDSIYTLKTQMTRVKMSISNAGMSISADSDEEADSTNLVQQLFAVMVKEMVNKPYTVMMTTKGSIQSVEGLEAIYQSAMETMAAQFPDISPMQINAATAQMKQAYGEEAMKSSLEMNLNVYPGTVVKTNDTWTKNINMQSGMDAKYDVEYTYVGDEADGIHLKGTGTLQTADKDAYQKIEGMDARYDLNGKYDAEYVLDAKTGWVKKATIKQSTSGNVEIKPGPQLPDGMNIPMEMTGTTTIN